MQWEYKLVALGLLVEATEPNQREKHEQILNNLGREGWGGGRVCRAKRHGAVKKTRQAFQQKERIRQRC
jgi:hypothetical protein